LVHLNISSYSAIDNTSAKPIYLLKYYTIIYLLLIAALSQNNFHKNLQTQTYKLDPVKKLNMSNQFPIVPA